MRHLASVISTSINQVINQSVFICKGLNHIQSHLEALCTIKYPEKFHPIIYFYFLLLTFTGMLGILLGVEVVVQKPRGRPLL